MTIKSADLFERMNPALEKYGKDIVAKVGAVYLFEIKPSKDAEPVFFTIDLKNGNGKHLLLLKIVFFTFFCRKSRQGQGTQGRHHVHDARRRLHCTRRRQAQPPKRIHDSKWHKTNLQNFVKLIFRSRAR